MKDSATKLVSRPWEHHAASGLKAAEFSTNNLLAPVSLWPHVHTTNTATGKGGITGTCPIPWAGRKQAPFSDSSVREFSLLSVYY